MNVVYPWLTFTISSFFIPFLLLPCRRRNSCRNIQCIARTQLDFPEILYFNVVLEENLDPRFVDFCQLQSICV